MPKDGNYTQPVVEFNKHTRKVGHVLFNPVAENVLLSSGADLLIKLYDIQKGSEIQEVSVHTDIVNSLTYNYDGSLIATCSKDKKLRLIDPRSNSVAQVKQPATFIIF
jgi:coronin-1B/1C/6